LKFAKIDIQDLTIRFSAEKAQYENQLAQCRAIYENCKNELDRVYDILGQCRNEHRDQVKFSDELKKEIDNLNEHLRIISSENQNRKDQNDGCLTRISELEQERNLYKAKLERLDVELNHTKSDLMGKIQQLDELRKRYEKSMETSTQLGAQLMERLMKV